MQQAVAEYDYEKDAYIAKKLFSEGYIEIPFSMIRVSKVVSFKATTELITILDNVAYEHGVKKSNLIRRIICKWLIEKGILSVEDVNDFCWPETLEDIRNI